MGELVRAQPPMIMAARETWEHAGLRCAIVASPMGGWCGYVQLPPGSAWRRAGWMEIPLDGPGGYPLTWGPDGDGWVGFDTAHAGDAWAPDDDSPPYQPAWWPATGQEPPPELRASMLEGIARLRRLTAGSLGGTFWTLPKLRAKVEDLAERLAVAGG